MKAATTSAGSKRKLGDPSKGKPHVFLHGGGDRYDLCCDHCQARLTILLPCDVVDAADSMHAFARRHRRCKKRLPSS